MTEILTAEGIRKSFHGNPVPVLNDVDMAITAGEFVAVMGPSGSGKSTLLYSVSGMDSIDSGSVKLAGQELIGLSEAELADVRRERMGFIFQQPALLKDLTLLENILLTSSLDRIGTVADRQGKAQELMERAGIWELRDRLTTEVSGGQLQRAGVCRALMRDPLIVFGDEPTGALNASMALEVMDLLSDLNYAGMTMLLVTHDINVAARAGRVLLMLDGQIVDEVRPEGDDRTALLSERLRASGI